MGARNASTRCSRKIVSESVSRKRYNMIFAPFYRRFRSILSSETSRWISRDHFKALVAAAPREEFEQAKLRVIIVAAILAYLLWYVLRDGVLEPAEYEVLAVTSGFLVFSALLSLGVLFAR